MKRYIKAGAHKIKGMIKAIADNMYLSGSGMNNLKMPTSTSEAIRRDLYLAGADMRHAAREIDHIRAGTQRDLFE